MDSSEALKNCIAETNVTTGGNNRSRQLYYQLKLGMARADGVDLIVSFLMESGVRMILEDLKAAVGRGSRIRILTGNYLGITQPSALYLIRAELGDQVDLRFYNDPSRSFHPKSYIFHYKKFSEIFIGSSNISKSALTSGIEWNYRFSSLRDPDDFRDFYHTFEDLFEHHSIVIDDAELKSYSAAWHRPAVYKDLGRYDDFSSDLIDKEDGIHESQRGSQTFEDTRDTENIREDGRSVDRSPADPEGSDSAEKITEIIQPRGSQIEALYALKQSVEEGAEKGLVQAATGVGKTYIAAFFSRGFKRVLFIAHRQEILNQAAQSFHNVRPQDSIGFFNGDRKDTKEDLIFASVETLGSERYLNPDVFKPEDFDLQIIDEFHHAVTKQYRQTIAYFHPRFLLGLTATPERMDGRDIFELCDYNVPFEMNLRDAINKGMLVPFHYYGIYDETDYSGLRVVRGHYDEKDLERAYIGNRKRYDLIYKYYQKYPSKRALGFCSSRAHAEDMAREFSKRGIPSAAVYSGEPGEYAQDRRTALEKLQKGEIRVIFSVDMFSEGLDVRNLDMVLFLRPTESPVIFLQQLGRGLRRYKGKDYLNVLDFIGNYQRAGSAPVLLSGDGKRHGSGTGEHADKDTYPDDCIVDFDMRLIDLFKKMQEKSRGVSDRIDAEFDRVQDLLGHVPTRMELFTHMDDFINSLCMAYSSKNPFKRYLEYLHRRHMLSMENQKLYDGLGKEFLNLVSTTSMSRVYKMPVLYAFYNNGSPRTEITDEEVLAAWKNFFNRGTNWKDLLSGKEKDAGRTSYEKYKALSDKWHLKKIHEMPIHFLLNSGKGFFLEKEGCALAVSPELEQIFGEKAFAENFRDILDYRTMDYYRRRYIDSKAEGILLFTKKVDKSLLKDGFAIPQKEIDHMLKAIGVTLSKGGKHVINIELDGMTYQAQLTSLDFGSKYQDQVRVQVRYGRNSEICEKMNELFQIEGITKEEIPNIRIVAIGEDSIRIEY